MAAQVALIAAAGSDPIASIRRREPDWLWRRRGEHGNVYNNIESNNL
jgi:hypothetical protein